MIFDPSEFGLLFDYIDATFLDAFGFGFSTSFLENRLPNMSLGTICIVSTSIPVHVQLAALDMSILLNFDVVSVV